MSETIKNLGSEKKISKKAAERRYDAYLDDPLTFSLDEMLQTLPCVVIRDEPRDLCTVTVFMALFFNLDKNFKAV